MKRTLVKIILVYLTISFSVFFLYNNQTNRSNEAIAVWNETENVPIAQIEATKVPMPTTAPTMTQAPVQAVTPKVTQEPVGETTPEVTQASVPTTVPVITEPPVVTTAPEITKKAEELRREKETVEYNGINFGYRNTSYRMSEHTMEKIFSMVCEEPYVSSFMLYDINTGAAISYNEEQYYPVASTIKAPFAMTCLWQIEEGVHSLEDTMVYIEESEEGTEETEKNSKTYTIKELIENAVTISDNVGYFLLQDGFGYEYYNRFLKNLGNRVTIGKGVKWGKTSAFDSLQNWKEIYDYIFSDRENADFFARLLKNTNKAYIRNALGEDYEVYNKMGWVRNQCCHDHAIVMAEEPYILILMTLGDVGKENQRFMENLAIVLNEVHEEMVEK